MRKIKLETLMVVTCMVGSACVTHTIAEDEAREATVTQASGLTRYTVNPSATDLGLACVNNAHDDAIGCDSENQWGLWANNDPHVLFPSPLQPFGVENRLLVFLPGNCPESASRRQQFLLEPAVRRLELSPMDTGSIPLPGALRLRPLRLLLEPDGSCPRVFDLERAAELEVPQELRLHLAPALESGDFDEPLLDWLLEQGLITSSAADEEEAAVGSPSGACFRLDGEVHARVDLAAEEELAGTLDAVFDEAAAAEAAGVVLHLASGGAFPRVSALERVVLEAERRAHATGLASQCELALGAPAVTARNVRFLAETPLHLRLAADAGAEGWVAAEEAARRLLAVVPDRLTFQAVLAPGARLRDLEEWAAEVHLLHLDVLPLGAHPEGPREEDLAAYRDDLLALAERLAAALAHGRLPLDLLAVTTVVRRLLRGAAAEGAYSARGEHPHARARLRAGAAAIVPIVTRPALRPVGADDPRLARCADCWARGACSWSADLAAPPADAAEPAWGPSPDRCGFRRAETMAALLLVRSLADPRAARALLDTMRKAPLDPFAHAALSWRGPARA